MTTATLSDREKALEALARLAPWRADDRDAWLRVGMALQAVGDDLFEAWDGWSQQSDRYDPKAMRATWRSFHAGDGISLGSLIAWANEDDPHGSNGTPRPAPRPRAAPSSNDRPKTIYPTFEAAIGAIERQTQGQHEQHWTYHDRDGSEALRVVRLRIPEQPGRKPKTYRPLHPEAGGWVLGDPDGLLPLYNLQGVQRADGVGVFEGEKCCDLAAGIGLVGTTSAHGAQSAKRTDWAPLAGKDVTLYPDRDKDGEKYTADVVAILAGLDPPATVRVVDLPGIPEGGDLEQWLEPRDSQEPETIRAALQALQPRPIETAATTSTGADSIDLQDRPIMRRLSDVAPQPIRWLWQPRIALGKLTLICGDPGLGKSFLTLDLSARVTRGTPWPDNMSGPGCCGSVVLMNAEDDVADTIRPRLDAAGADVSRVIALEGVQIHGGQSQRSVTLADLDAIEGAIHELPDCRLVIVDPVSAYLAGIDSHKNSDTRALLAPLAALASKHAVAVVMITHLSKTGGARAMYRAMGSLAFIAAARAAYLVSEDKADPARRLFLPLKNNLGDDRNGLAYRLIDGAVAWEPDTITTTADDALAAEADREGGQGVRAECKEWLRDLLAGGPIPVKDAEAQAKAAGFSAGTLRRAREELPIKVYAAPGVRAGPWLWRLKGTVAQVSPDNTT
jgi:hypothetical protein